MNEDKEKKTYELALLVKTEEAAAGPIELLRQHNGETLGEPRMKKLALAYRIKGETEAVFISLGFRAFPEEAKNLEHDLSTRQDVLRSMVLVAPPPSERPAMTAFPQRGRPMGARAPMGEAKPVAPRPLSNEALEKKIEEILG